MPVWHITERTFELWMLTRSCKVVYSSIRTFKNDMAKHKPEWLVLVPRVLEKIASGVQDKFTSGTGWPSFTRSLPGDRVSRLADHSLGVTRTEILCSRCGGHLGHVFPDGPPPTGERYCVNGNALDFTVASK